MCYYVLSSAGQQLRNGSPLFPNSSQLITTPVNISSTPVTSTDSQASLLVAPAVRTSTPTLTTTDNTISQANLLVAPAVRHGTPNSTANPLISNLTSSVAPHAASLTTNMSSGNSKFIPISSAGPSS